MTVSVVLSLLTAQVCYCQLQQPPVQQLPIQPAQPQLYTQTNGQPGTVADLFRVAAASLSQTLINLLNYKTQWFNQLSSTISQSSPALSTSAGVQSPSLQPILSTPVGSVPTSGIPNTGLPAPIYQQPPAVPVQSTQLQSTNPIATPPQNPLPATQGSPLIGANPIVTPPQNPPPATQGSLTAANPPAPPVQTPQFAAPENSLDRI